MTMSMLIKKTEHLEITKLKRPKDINRLRQKYVAFSGAPRKHPYDAFRVILVVDPFSTNTFYYEFNIDDIAFVEELPNIVTMEDEVIPNVRIWVQKGSIGTRCTPFWVEDTFA
ncbi:MAG: inorganic pyrophosphatase Ppa [Desulfosarcinaceae bacterium]